MRVLVVRAAEQAAATAARLRARGHEPVLHPLLAVEALPLSTPPTEADALLVTSVNAVPAAAGLPAEWWGKPAFAVGARSAFALRAAGFATVIEGEGGGAELARLVGERLPAGAHLLHLAGQDRRPEPGRSLSAAGFAVGVREVYAIRRAERLPPALSAMLGRHEIDAVLHFSEASAALVLDLADDAGLALILRDIAHVCLSEAIATHVRERGCARVAPAARPSDEAVVSALDEVHGFRSHVVPRGC